MLGGNTRKEVLELSLTVNFREFFLEIVLFAGCVQENSDIMNKVIRGGAREIIYKVFMWCMAEYQAGKLLSKLDDVYKRTADFTGK